MNKSLNRDITGYWNVRKIMRIENLEEKDIPIPKNSPIVEITPEGGVPFQCSSLNNVAKLLKVSSSTVKYAYDR